MALPKCWMFCIPSSVSVVGIATVQVELFGGDTVKTPDGISLGEASSDLGNVGILVLLDVADVRMSRLGQGVGLCLSAREADGKSVNVGNAPVAEDFVTVLLNLAGECETLLVGDVLVHHKDVLIINLTSLLEAGVGQG